MLSPLGRRLRGGTTAAVLALTLIGTAAGDDDHFPLGPFRMFSTKTSRDGAVNVSLVRGVTMDGQEVRLSMASFGLRRAEFEGQLERIARDPSLLAVLVRARSRTRPNARPLREVRLIAARWELADGRKVGYVERSVAVWTAP